MKRLALLAASVLFASTLYAQTDQRDVLVTPGGTLFTVDSQLAPNDPDMRTQLLLTAQNGDQKSTTIVPESQTAGFRATPALAYDDETDTLFIFWLRMPDLMSSELLVASYRNGMWTTPISIDNHSFRLRSNLQIAVTRRAAQVNTDGQVVDVPALVLHTVWWEQSTTGEQARYALVSIDRGTVANIDIHDLSEFAAPATPAVVDPNFNSEILRHPAILGNGTDDSIDVLFGDVHTNTFSRSTLKPVIEGRIHIPIGHTGGPPIFAPHAFSANWSGQISAIGSTQPNGKLLLYNRTSDAVNYLLFDGSAWSSVRSVPVSDKLSGEAAVAALNRMMSASQ